MSVHIDNTLKSTLHGGVTLHNMVNFCVIGQCQECLILKYTHSTHIHIAHVCINFGIVSFLIRFLSVKFDALILGI